MSTDYTREMLIAVQAFLNAYYPGEVGTSLTIEVRGGRNVVLPIPTVNLVQLPTQQPPPPSGKP